MTECKSELLFRFLCGRIPYMKADIHPTYYPEAKVKCACGNTFEVGSTQETIEIEVCSACHPFYTGQDKVLDKMGQVQKFRRRMAAKESKALEKKSSQAKTTTTAPKAKKTTAKKKKKAS